MLTYRRRNSSTSETRISTNNGVEILFLGYCNWSYSRGFQITIDNAKYMFNQFDTKYIPYYVRIFNEMPAKVLNDFIEKYNISKNLVRAIYIELGEKTSFKIKSL